MSIRNGLLAIVLLTGFGAVLAGPAAGGKLDPELASQVANAAPDQQISALVMGAEQMDIAELERQIDALGHNTRQQRHEFVVEQAQGLAARTQGDLLRTLQAWKDQGRVRSFQAFWITNMIAVQGLPGVFPQLAARADVGTIYVNAPVQPRTAWAEGRPAPPNAMLTLPDNLVCVNLQPAWNLGFKGQGRLVATFDSGADGNHPAFASRWRGARPGRHWWEGWRDLNGTSTFPFDPVGHGTHVLGILCGQKPDGTPIGVAPGADWICASVLMGYDEQKVIDCYQWATDPDGNPSTVDDVPDVINNSWGTSADCIDTYWNAIDVVEAAGIVNTIAVDNTGPGYATVNSPESRALNNMVNFGVGNVDPHTAGYPINNSSGRGPSPCDFVSIKPNVSGPGTAIYSSLPNNSYGALTGTSMACPHVSGAVTILRQVNPDLTVADIKTALMSTALDRGATGPDNDYGWGIVNIGSAVNYVRQRLPHNPPTNLAATVQTDSVTLTWDRPYPVHPNNPLLTYRVYRAPLGQAFPTYPIAEFPDSLGRRYVDAHIAFGSYHYVVMAHYQVNTSGSSNDVQVPQTAWMTSPRNVATSVQVDTVSLSWTRPWPVHPGNPLQRYRVYRAPLGQPFPQNPIGEVPDSTGIRAYRDPNLPNGSYHYGVTAKYAAGESGVSNDAQAVIYPRNPPRNLTASVAAGDTVALAWQRPDSVQQGNPIRAFRVYRAPLGQPFPAGAIAEIADSLATGYLDHGEAFGSYHYAATAVYLNAESARSNDAEIDASAWINPPTGLGATVAADTVVLNWNRPAPVHPGNPVVAYPVYRAPLGQPFPQDSIGVATDLSYRDAGVPFGSYHYEVRARYAAGVSGPSNDFALSDTTWTRPPTALTASVAGDSVLLHWTRPAPVHPGDPIAAYRIFRALLNEAFGTAPLTVVPDSLGVTSYVDPHVAFASYHYVVTAEYRTTESGRSNEAQVVESEWMNPPTEVTSSVIGDSVKVAWRRPGPINPGNPVRKYRIFRALLGEPFGTVPIGEVADSSGGTFFVDAHVPFADLHYVVTAQYVAGESGPSNETQVRQSVWMQPPRNLTAFVLGGNVALSWFKPGPPVHPGNPVLTYRIYRAPVGQDYPADPVGVVPDSLGRTNYVDSQVPGGTYHYVTTAVYVPGESPRSNEIQVTVNVSSAVDPTGGVTRFVLKVIPNPFNPIAVVRYSAPGPQPVTIRIYDPRGAEVRRLIDNQPPAAGERSVVWDGTDANGHAVASGAYFVRFEHGSRTLSKRIILLK